MPDTFAPDNGSLLAMKLNGDVSPYVLIPCGAGSRPGRPSSLRKLFLAANSGFEPVNQFRTVTQVGFLARTMAFGGANGFFKPTLLQAMIARGANGYLASLGKAQFRYGSGAGGDWSEGHAQSKLGMLEIVGGPGGSPIAVNMLAQLYGGENATVLGTPTAPGNADLYMTEGVTYNGLLSGVESWSISVNNTLRPRLTTPYPAGMTNAGGHLYCPEYDNGPMLFSVTVVQRLGAEFVIDTSLATISTLKISCVDQAGLNPVVFTCKVQQPSREAVFSLDGTGYVSRTYENLAPDSATASLAIGAA